MNEGASRVRDALIRRSAEFAPVDFSRQLEELDSEEARPALMALPSRLAAQLLSRMTEGRAAALLAGLTPAEAAPILLAIDPGRGASLLARLEAHVRDSLLAELPEGTARELRELSEYPDDTAGRSMDPRPVALHPDSTVEHALSRLRGRRSEPIAAVFVVHPETKQLSGVVRLADLATAEPTDRLEEIAVPPEAVVHPFDDREQVADVLARTRFPVLPVVDLNGRLLGVIRYAALIDAARQDATADLQTMVGASREERALSPVSFAVKKRLPWLQVNLGTAFLAAGVVGAFEETIARNTALAVLLPVVAGQSGNTGSQALAVVIRALALREIRAKQWRAICWKEARVGFLNGIAVALVCAVAVFLWSGSAGLGGVIAVSMVLSMTIAGFSGAAVPIALSAVGQDPAQSSSILLTTVTDVAGFLSFLGIATILASRL